MIDRTARLWPVAPAPGEPLSLEHGSWVTAAQFSGDGRYVVTASYDRTARVWLAQTGQAVTPPLRHGHAVWRASFSPDGRYVLTAGLISTMSAPRDNRRLIAPWVCCILVVFAFPASSWYPTFAFCIACLVNLSLARIMLCSSGPSWVKSASDLTAASPTACTRKHSFAFC